MRLNLALAAMDELAASLALNKDAMKTLRET